ncbi:sodium/proline symporter PutP [Corynebacterium sp. ES2794-CONJ1]|uniref:sodium/proline symporter PutP n=1 Tax=unclassified Corynebacterium TaxID=2624378 RepID=UPI0021684D25|nr:MULTISPECIES: sodium/proline symporter PutP [unclassified Corynebacterium]MCS4491789.1 sodium/proline symporter PutP [Corynebacterium sp. ES2715-CONJ3]MCS4531894.1 sodium/proline symporter PutP [Corynebacterium sp. ES2730-CONJ]MCU9519295.1 sodium/proline symporter PutP [Corynebacterium sp. ES2794-CONJ1]
MSDQTWYILAIIIYMSSMLGIGYWSYRQTDAYDDYVLAGRGLNPFVAAMSAGASDMSGWLLMGLPGALFVSGISELWIAVGLIAGAWANWKWVAPRLRAYSEVASDSVTIPSFFENRLSDSSRLLRVVSALIIVVFFTFYVSSGMVAGGRYFESTFGGNYLDGMLIVAFITVVYTFVGGFLAVSYTDAVQGTIMFCALIIVPVMALFYLDDPSSIWTWAAHNDYGPYTSGVGNPTYFSMVSGVSFAAIIGNMAWGLGYFGQPHIIVRFMALRSPSDAKRGRAIGIGWMILTIAGATFVAIIGTAFFGQNPNISIVDRQAFETIFLDMGRILFHPLIAGLILTAVLAAIMSTISSQLLVSSTSLIEDLYLIVVKKKPRQQVLINLSRTAVVAVAVVAGILSVNPSDSILGLVGFAWAGFGSAFGPLVLLSLYWKRLNTQGALAGMITGAIVVFIWGSTSLGEFLYEMVPGVISSFVVTVVVSLITAPPQDTVTQQFMTATARARD